MKGFLKFSTDQSSLCVQANKAMSALTRLNSTVLHTALRQTVWKPNLATSISKSARILRFVRPSAPCSSLLVVDNYVQLQKLAKEKLHEALASPTRFQSINERKDITDIIYDSTGKYISEYRGAFLMKNPNDLSVYYQLFTHVRPKVVFEMGTYSGASAIWYNDTAKSLDLDCHIYSIDIEPLLLDEGLKQRKPNTVDFIIGDMTKIENVFPPSMLEPLPHPWLIVEDSHDNANAVIEHFHQFMEVGDYLVIEDTSPHVPTNCNAFEKDTTQCEPEKLNMLKSLLRSPVGQHFKVDSFFTDLYGYNCTWHWHGFLRKCS